MVISDQVCSQITPFRYYYLLCQIHTFLFIYLCLKSGPKRFRIDYDKKSNDNTRAWVDVRDKDATLLRLFCDEIGEALGITSKDWWTDVRRKYDC